MNQEQAFQISKDFLQKENDFFTKEDVKKLGKLIAFHSELYYEQEKPIISDSEYDELFKKLQFLEEKFGMKHRMSKKVGSAGKRSSFKKVSHSRSMISLDNTYNAEELRDFDVRIKRILRNNFSTQNLTLTLSLEEREQAAKSQNKMQSLSPGGDKGETERSDNFEVGAWQRIQEGGFKELNVPYTIEFKFDGLGIELIYQDGSFIQAITRGNGLEGEDVTENIKQIQNIPQKINKTGRFEVRGEVVMPISSFERLNEEAKKVGDKVFSNPRNAASGSLRVLDTSITKKRDLKYFAYDVSDYENLTLTLSLEERGRATYSDMIHYLQSLGFEISSYFPRCKGIEEVISHIENIGNIKSQIDFEVDGLVVKVDDISLWKEVGSTEHHPRYAIAYKFPAEIVTTQVLSVEHSVGRTGTITPVANLEPVNIAGAIIRRATLHNYEEVEKLGVKIYDKVFLKRAGEVIPKIISVASSPYSEDDSEAQNYMILPPKVCPSCGSEVLKDIHKVRYYCPNSYGCPAQMGEKIAFAVGKQGFNIDGFGEKQAELFYSLGYIRNLGDIFRLKNYREQILALEGFQEKSVSNLLEGIEKVRKCNVVIFLKALGIPGVGKKTAKTLASIFYSKEDFDFHRLPTQEKIEQLPDIGPEVASSLRDFFHSQQDNIEDILAELILIFPKKSEKISGKYTGKKMCITGSFEGYSRDQLVEVLEQQGGEFMSSVSAKTDYLLAGEKAGSKLKKAQELGITLLRLEDFLK